MNGKQVKADGEDSAPCFLPVVDRTSQIAPNYFKTVFFRDSKRTAHVPLYRWLWYCILEIFFGEELLENLVITASLSGSPDAPDQEGRYGWPLQLALHIPAGVFTNIFRQHLIELLYYKFYHQYLLIEPIANVYADGECRDVTRVRFRLKKTLLYQLISFRRVYLAEALVMNLTLDLFVYGLTESVGAMFIAGFSLLKSVP